MAKIGFASVGVLALILGLTGITTATSFFTFDLGANSWVDVSGTNEVLQMYGNVNPNLDDIIFSLHEGESYQFYFGTFGTTEGWINRDDIYPGQLTAYVDFDNPDITQAIGGTSVGFQAGWHFLQGWTLVWDDPVIVDFPAGGQFEIELSDVGYNSWWWQGPNGSADVYARVTLRTDPVPEPSTLFLLGTGLIGLAAYSKFRRKKK